MVRVVLHVLLGVLVGGDELEAEASEEDGASKAEVLLLVVVVCDGVLVCLLLHEFAANSSGVLIANLVDLDRVITAVEGDNEFTVLIIRLRRDELGVEPKNVHVLLEHLLHVGLGDLWAKGYDGAHGVLLSAEALVGWHWLILDGWGSGGELDGHLNDAELTLIPLLGEIVAVEDLAVTTVDFDGSAAVDVSGHVVFFCAERHAWAVSQDWGLGQLLSLQQLREGGAATVLCVDLLDLDGVITEEEVQGVEFITTVVADVLPKDLEAEDAAIVVKEALEAAVGATTL